MLKCLIYKWVRPVNLNKSKWHWHLLWFNWIDLARKSLVQKQLKRAPYYNKHFFLVLRTLVITSTACSELISVNVIARCKRDPMKFYLIGTNPWASNGITEHSSTQITVVQIWHVQQVSNSFCNSFCIITSTWISVKIKLAKFNSDLFQI